MPKPRSKKETLKPVLFLVEGKTDAAVIPYLFKGLEKGVDAKSIQDVLDVDDAGGFDKFEQSFNNTFQKIIATGVSRKSLKSIVILVDGDNKDTVARREDIIKIIRENTSCQSMGLLPNMDETNNSFQELTLYDKQETLKHTLHIGVFIIQDETDAKEYQDLESCLLKNTELYRPRHYALVEKFRQQVLEGLNPDEVPSVPGHLNKAMFRTYIAIQKESEGFSNFKASLEKDCFNYSLEEQNMAMLKACYQQLTRILNDNANTSS